MPLDSQASVIEKGIPVPSRRGFRFSEIDRIVACMDIGDSILPARIGLKASAFKTWAQRRNNGTKFTIHNTREGHRVWRIA